MPIPVPAALDDAGALAATKASALRASPLRYLASSALAGAYVGIAVVLLISVSAPLAATGAAATKLVQAAVFGVALTLVVFAGAELFTGNAMVMLQGLRARTVRAGDLAGVWGASLVGNLVGSLALAAVVHGGGTMTGPGADLIATVTDAKAAAAGPQLFWRSVLCNLLVCLGLWMASRVQSDAAKAIVLWWALLAFIGSGFEHSIANMTIFGLGILEGSATAGELARNLLWTVPGNVVGGGLIVGLGYAWIGRPATPREEASTAVGGALQPARR
ncbi:MAG TPA: formate/nitrite transporter family protein [Iamia sp.]|nr:formate/nitrite transporter family protein [Iamia sp.]